jgi:hypothetical protein
MELWELIARESIRDRIARWNSNGDAGRREAMVQVLAPDVEFHVGGSPVIHGRGAVHEFLLGLRAEHHDGAPDAAGPAVGRYVPPGERPSIRHFTSTMQIDFVSEVEATVRTYYVVLSSFGLDHWGRYLDDFRVVDGEWLIVRREVTVDAADPDGWAASVR